MSSRALQLLAVTFASVLGCSASSGAGEGAHAVGGAAGASMQGVAGAAPSAGNSGLSSGGAGGTSAIGGAGTFGSAGQGVFAGASGVGGAGVGASGGNAGNGGATTSPCGTRPGLLFCDDFETATAGAVPGAPWSSGINGGGTVTVDATTPAHSGTKSVKVHGSGFQTLLVYHDPAVLPQASGKFFFRAFVRFDQPMTGGHNTFVIADTFAAPGTGSTTRVGEMNAMLMMTVGGDAHGYLSNQNYYNDSKPGVQFAAQAYTCLEMLFDAPHTEIDVWVNGKEVPDMHVTDLMHDNYDALRFGFEQYAGPVSDLWYDDIAIGSQQIGCN